MGFSVKFKGLRDKKTRQPAKVYQYVHRRLTRLWKDCILVFVKATSESMKVDTGMSIASLLPLGQKVQRGTKTPYHITTNLKGRKGTAKKPLFNIDGTIDLTKKRSFNRGFVLGKDAYYFTTGSPRRVNLTFTFFIVVYQYAIQEQKAWHSLNNGAVEFTNFFNNNLHNYVQNEQIVKYLITGEII